MLDGCCQGNGKNEGAREGWRSDEKQRMLGVGSDGGTIELRLVEEGGTFSADREAGAGHPGSGWVPVCWGDRQRWGSLLCRSVVTDCTLVAAPRPTPLTPGSITGTFFATLASAGGLENPWGRAVASQCCHLPTQQSCPDPCPVERRFPMEIMYQVGTNPGVLHCGHRAGAAGQSPQVTAPELLRFGCPGPSKQPSTKHCLKASLCSALALAGSRKVPAAPAAPMSLGWQCGERGGFLL